MALSKLKQQEILTQHYLFVSEVCMMMGSHFVCDFTCIQSAPVHIYVVCEKVVGPKPDQPDRLLWRCNVVAKRLCKR